MVLQLGETRMLVINVSIANLAVARLEHFIISDRRNYGTKAIDVQT